MSIDGTANYFPLTINGLQDVSSDSQTVTTLQVNSLTPNRIVVSDGSNYLTSSGATALEADYLIGTTSNIQNQLNSKATTIYVDTNFLNKTTTSNQTVSGKVEFQDVITNTLQSIFNSGLKITNPTLGSWTITVEYIDAYSQNLLFYNIVSGATIRFTGDYGFMKSLGWGPNRVMITNSSSELVTSGVDAIKITYLDNVSSDIQTQLNSKLNLSGSNADQDIILGSYKVQSSGIPSIGNDLTNKTYVDTAIGGLGSVYVLKAGDTMTGTLYNSAGDFHAYRGGDTNRGCILTANNADGASYSSNNGGLASWYGISFKSIYDNTTRFVFNTRDGNSSQTGTMTANAVNIDGQTASRVCVLDASKNIVSSSVTSTTLSYLDIGSSLTGLLNAKASTTYVDTQDALRVAKSGDTMTGALNMNGATVIEFGSGVSGKDANAGKVGYGTFDASALCMVGAGTSSSDRRVRIWDRLGVGKLPRDDSVLDVEGNIITGWGNYRIGTQYDTVTSGYFLGMATAASTRELYLVSQSADSGGSGAVIITTGSTPSERVRWTHDGIQKFPNAVQNRLIVLYEGANNDYQYYGIGINAYTFRFNVPETGDKYSFFAGTGSTSATEVFRINGTGALESGVSGGSANTTANLKMASSASHIDNNAGEVYLFTGTNGHLGIQRNTTRNASTSCLALGTADTEQSEVISYKADGSGYMPLAYAGSVHAWVVGNSTDTELVSYSLLGQTGFDGSNNVNFQCQASQYGRNRLYMTGRYEAGNDGWAFASGRNSIIFRTQSSLNSAYTNRWAIQNFADKLGILSSDTPTMVFSGSYVGIGTTSPSNELQVVGTATTTVLNVGGTDHFRIESFSSYRRIQSFGGQPLSINPLGNYVGIGITNPNAQLHVYNNINGALCSYVHNVSSGSSAYALMAVINNTGNGAVLFQNSNTRTDDGGVNTATLRNDAGTLRVQAQYGLGLTIDNDGCVKANCGTVSSTNPGSANMAAYFGIVRGDARNSAGLWTGIDSGNNVWQLSLRPDVSWNGFNARAAYYTWYVSNGPTSGSLLINNNGAVNVAGNTTVAVPNGYMARGSLTIGSIDQNYGWGSNWNSNTAGLLFECADLTEIAVHDSGHRVASMIAYAGGAGRNWLVLGRDMGWGASYVTTASTFSVATDSQYGRFNVYNSDGSYTHFGTSERVNYVRGGKTLFDTTTDTYWLLNWYYDANSPGAHLHNAYGTWAVSIWATGAVVTNYWFGTVSDRRLKKNIKPVDSMLSTIKRIEVVSFDFIDSNNKRDECGVIAQQVEEVFPNIVDKSVGVVPNILKRATSFQKDEGTLTVFYPRQPEDVVVGERVKLMFGVVGATEADSKKKGEYTERVLQVEPGSITVEWTSSDDIDGLSLIVYGREVEDFRNVDKEQFGVMAIKGIQELSEQIEEQQKQIEEQQKQIEEQQKTIDLLSKNNQLLEDRLRMVEQLLERNGLI